MAEDAEPLVSATIQRHEHVGGRPGGTSRRGEKKSWERLDMVGWWGANPVESHLRKSMEILGENEKVKRKPAF